MPAGVVSAPQATRPSAPPRSSITPQPMIAVPGSIPNVRIYPHRTENQEPRTSSRATVLGSWFSVLGLLIRELLGQLLADIEVAIDLLYVVEILEPLDQLHR